MKFDNLQGGDIFSFVSPDGILVSQKNIKINDKECKSMVTGFIVGVFPGAWDVIVIPKSYRIQELEAVIKRHRDQKADDRCIEDDDELYQILYDGILCDRRVGSKEEMKKNCDRFIENRCEGGSWPSYADLEKEIVKLKYELEISGKG